MDATAVVANLHKTLSSMEKVVKGFRDGDRVRIDFQGVTAFGMVAIAGASGIKIGEIEVELDGTGQRIRLSEAYVTKEGAK